MPYKDPEKQKAAKRASAHRARVRASGEATSRVVAEHESGVPRVLPDPPAKDELLRLLGVQARSGSVRALELLLRMETAVDEATSSGSIIDDLAQRRNYARSAGA